MRFSTLSSILVSCPALAAQGVHNAAQGGDLEAVCPLIEKHTGK
jgi:hypothetical protein